MCWRYDVCAQGRSGHYESDTLVGLLVLIIKHRTWHLFKHGKWMD